MDDPAADVMQIGFFDEVVEEEEVLDTPPGVSKEQLQKTLRKVIEDACDYADNELASLRLEATRAFKGNGLATDAELDDTRSKAVSRDVHDVIMAILPSLIRVFFSGREVVSYTPEKPDDEQFAKQATDYVNDIVLAKDNEGFMIFYSVIHDALLKGLGVFKWWWDTKTAIEAHSYSGLGMETFQVLAGDPTVTSISGVIQDPMTGMISCTATRKLPQGGFARLMAVPPEERLINPTARSVDDSTFYGHRRDILVSDLVAMGFDYKQVVKLATPGGGKGTLGDNEENIERFDNVSVNSGLGSINEDPSQREVEYVECYIRADMDADGIAELYRVCVAGPNHDILEMADTGEDAIEMVDGIPFAELCPYPEPHMATGGSVSAEVIDIQLIKTGLLRATLDSLARSIFPREEVVEQQVNMDDVLNSEIGATVRVKAPGMVREIITQFMGKECIPIMEYMDNIKADRTGISDTTQGLNPESLQSTAKAGVEAAVSASQSQLEMIARVLAQTGVVRLFKGLLKLIKTHQDQARTVKLRGTWAEVDPRAWNGEMDAAVNTALGRGTDTEKMAMLALISQKQETIMQTLGPYNQLCTPREYRETLAEMVTLAGYYNPDRFFLPIEIGQVVEKMNQELQEAKQTAQQATEENHNLKWQLRNHSEAEDAKNNADAFKKGAETVKTVVEAAQLANQQVVDPNAAQDELAAASPGG